MFPRDNDDDDDDDDESIIGSLSGDGREERKFQTGKAPRRVVAVAMSVQISIGPGLVAASL